MIVRVGVGRALRRVLWSAGVGRALPRALWRGSLLAVLPLAACSDRTLLVPPTLPAGTVPFTPDAVYATWWQQVEVCAGRRGDLGRVHWFVVPSSNFFTYQGEEYDGYWWGEIHWIVLASAYQNDGPTVRHEMLHDLLDRGDHPAAYFQERCHDVVECNAACRRDGGP
ncbi:MAG TPA: hypothetical protein VJU87_00270 [Gemmatimonadaceae bacterium]|nr:hypothetical protein [Gemmatimonadaceae bacterium]